MEAPASFAADERDAERDRDAEREREATAALERAVERAAQLLEGHRVAVLTGAGISTDSGIPDYRSPGRPRRVPMTWQEFSSSPERRRRYWAGASIGWPRFDRVQPNDAHRALAALERAGIVSGVATQNIDSLHLRAGSRRVIELHGHLRTVHCMNCGAVMTRRDVLAQIRAKNPALNAFAAGAALNPDGDADISPELIATIDTPVCRVCGGDLAPDVVMFGQHVRPENTLAANALVDESDALLVAGTSLAVNTGVRLVHRMRRRGVPVVIINRGPTGSDHDAVLRIDAGTTETLRALAHKLLANRSNNAPI